MKLLSLIMIVRDEASQLVDFLEHHRGLFDEMIIVDTGSVDDSRALIKEAGATLLEHVWDDDFSKARNVGVKEAQGRWLLLLDADERIAQKDFIILREFLAQAPEAVYLQNTINYFQGTHLEWQPLTGRYPQEEKNQKGFFAAQRPGLFPQGHGLEFRGRVHESILPSSLEVGLKTYSLDIPVHHFGYVLDPAANQRRQVRYRKLVTLKLNDDPNDWGALLEMASIQLEDGQVDQAENLLEKLSVGPVEHPAVSRGLFLLGKLNREKGQIDTARQLLLKARQANAHFLFAWLESIRLEAGQKAWMTVSQLLEEAREHFPDQEPLLKREKLMLLVQTGQLAEATVVAGQLAEICPGWQDIKALAQKLDQWQVSQNKPDLH